MHAYVCVCVCVCANLAVVESSDDVGILNDSNKHSACPSSNILTVSEYDRKEWEYGLRLVCNSHLHGKQPTAYCVCCCVLRLEGADTGVFLTAQDARESFLHQRETQQWQNTGVHTSGLSCGIWLLVWEKLFGGHKKLLDHYQEEIQCAAPPPPFLPPLPFPSFLPPSPLIPPPPPPHTHTNPAPNIKMMHDNQCLSL